MRQSTYRILGLDPGLGTTGYAFIDAKGTEMHLVQPFPGMFACGVIKTDPECPTAQRLMQLSVQLRALIEVYRPDRAAVETFFFTKSARVANQVGQARGVILLALAAEGLPFTEHNPQDVKQVVTGERFASKALVGAHVQQLLLLPAVPRPDDAADAAAVGICHLRQKEEEREEEPNSSPLLLAKKEKRKRNA